MKKQLLNFFTVLLAVTFSSGLVIAQTGPGGVGGHEDEITEGSPINAFWVRADDLTLGDGAEVTRWDDVSGYNHSAVPGVPIAGEILYESDKVNGHPWVRFHGVNFLKVADHDILDGGEGLAIFLVAKRDSFKVDKYGGASALVNKRGHWNIWSHVPEITAEGLEHAYEIKWDKFKTVTPGADSGVITAFLNGNLPDGAGSDVFPTAENTTDTDSSYIISYAYTSAEGSYGAFVRAKGLMTSRRPEGNPNPIVVGDIVSSSKDLYIGASQLDPPGNFGDNPNKNDRCPDCTESDYLEGALSEVIIYKGTLWHTHVFIVENYLSLKYGLPIGDEKYYDDDTFLYDLIGIGNEMGDDKKHTKSTAQALTIEELNGSLDAEKEYVFVAHDNVPYDITTEGMADENAERWGKTWRLLELGEADVAFTFDFIAAGLRMQDVQNYRVAYKSTPEEDFVLLDAMPSKFLRSLIFELEGENLQSGYYTLAYMQDENSVPNFNLSTDMNVFPNPANENLSLKFVQEFTGPIEIRILDLSGRELTKIEDTKISFEYSKDLKIDNLDSGAYLIEIRINKHFAIQTFMKK